MRHHVFPRSEAKGTNRKSGTRLLVVLALLMLGLGTWYFTHGSSRSSELVNETAAPTTDSTEMDARARAERRLRELRAAHERTGSDAREARSGALEGPPPIEGGKFRVPTPGAAGSGVAKVRPRVGASAAGAEAQGAGETDYEELDPDDIPALKRMALEDPDPDRRLAAVTLLGASDDPQAIPILAEVLKDQDEEVRLAAIQSLADMTGDVPVEVLGNAALSDPSPDNRYEALEALADVGGAAARSYIEKALQDPNEDVASLAESLLELGHDTAPNQ